MSSCYKEYNLSSGMDKAVMSRWRASQLIKI